MHLYPFIQKSMQIGNSFTQQVAATLVVEASRSWTLSPSLYIKYICCRPVQPLNIYGEKSWPKAIYNARKMTAYMLLVVKSVQPNKSLLAINYLVGVFSAIMLETLGYLHHADN